MLRTAAAILLIALIGVWGMPLFFHQDLNRDNQIDLIDAILISREFVNVSEDTAHLSHSMAKAASVLQIAAGMKMVICKTEEAVRIFSQPAFSASFLPVGQFQCQVPDAPGLPVSAIVKIYTPPDLDPVSPPPRLNLPC